MITKTHVTRQKLSYLLCEHIMGKDILDAAKIGGPSDDLHAKSSTDKLYDGTELLHVEMYRHEEKHGPER